MHISPPGLRSIKVFFVIQRYLNVSLHIYRFYGTKISRKSIWHPTEMYNRYRFYAPTCLGLYQRFSFIKVHMSPTEMFPLVELSLLTEAFFYWLDTSISTDFFYQCIYVAQSLFSWSAYI